MLSSLFRARLPLVGACCARAAWSRCVPRLIGVSFLVPVASPGLLFEQFGAAIPGRERGHDLYPSCAKREHAFVKSQGSLWAQLRHMLGSGRHAQHEGSNPGASMCPADHGGCLK
jgi:hypothetical protein